MLQFNIEKLTKNKFVKRTITAILFLFFATSTFAQDGKSVSQMKLNSSAGGFNQALSMCPGGIAFGIFSANYQYMFAESQSLVARVDYEAVPKTYTSANIESSGLAFILNYRWHISGDLESYYVGAFARYRVFSGSGKIDSQNFDFKIPDQTFGINVGKRWVWNSGFTLNFTFGYGFQMKGRHADPSNPAIESAIDDYEDAYDFMDPFLGEFSIGYAF